MHLNQSFNLLSTKTTTTVVIHYKKVIQNLLFNNYEYTSARFQLINNIL